VDEDPFSRELRAARARIAELQRRQGAAGGSSRRLLPEALAEVDVALEELAVTGQELREQTAELAVAREALEAERERYQELFQSAPVAYLVTDPLGGIREANRAAAELLQVRPGHLHGKPLADFVVYDDRWEFRVMLNRLRLGGEPRVEESPLRLRRRGGEAAAVLVTVAVVRDRQGAVRALRWLVRDPAGTGGPEPLLVISIDQAIRQAEAPRRGPGPTPTSRRRRRTRSCWPACWRWRPRRGAAPPSPGRRTSSSASTPGWGSRPASSSRRTPPSCSG